MSNLLGDDSDEVQFKVNDGYASKYSKWRAKECKQKWVDRKKNWQYSDSSSSDDDDDDDAPDLQEFEKNFYKTLSYLKKKDPRVYDNGTNFFPEQLSSTESVKETEKSKKVSKNKKDKPFVLRDYERQIILERDGKLSDDEEITKDDPRSSSPTYVEEQKALKESFKQALENSDAEEEKDDFGNLFKKKEKTEVELCEEEEDYKLWLKGRKAELKDKKIESDLKELHDYWNDPNLSADEAYLKDYILNKRFLDHEDESFQPEVHDSCDLAVDQRYVDEMEQYEKKYNFRFEEPDSNIIKHYPRNVETSLRRKDDRRKTKRQEIRERKEAEKAVKREEIKQLKAIKKKEIIEKIEKIKQITGNDDVNLQDEDFEEDFSPDKHDQIMRELFNDDYYQVKEEEKPECPDLERDLEIEDWENWKGKDHKSEQYDEDALWTQPQSEDPNFNMDCDYNPKAQLQDELVRMCKSKKKRKRLSKFAEALAKEKPVFQSSTKKFDEYFDEYYKLDCEDIIDDLPCRFKYRQTTPNNYGLTVDEILRADVKELNAWCSLKKVLKYKTDAQEVYDVQAYKSRATNEALKRKFLPSLYVNVPFENMEENENAAGKSAGRKRKKKSKINIEDDVLNEDSERSEMKNAVTIVETTTQQKKKKRKKKFQENGANLQPGCRNEQNFPDNSTVNDSSQKSFVTNKKKKSVPESTNIPISDARLKAYGVHPKKFKNKIKYGNKQNMWN